MSRDYDIKIVVYNAATMTEKQAKDTAAWLRKQARYIQQNRGILAKKCTLTKQLK